MRERSFRVVVVLAWLLSLAGVFALGTFLGTSLRQGSSGGEELGAATVWIYTRLGVYERSGETRPLRSVALERLVALEDALERRYFARELARELEAGELGEVVQELTAMPRTAGWGDAVEPFLARWGSVDPRGALAFAASQGGEGTQPLPPEATEAILRGWAAESPALAWQWVRQHGGSDPGNWLQAVAGAVALRNPEEAFRLANQLEDSAQRMGCLRAIITERMEHERPQRLAELIETRLRGPMRDEMLRELVGRWARQDPAAAAVFAERQRGALYQQLVPAAVTTWAERSPREAADWARELAPGLTRSVAVAKAIAGWLRAGELGAAASWLNDQPPHEDWDSSIEELARATIERDPEAALAWALAIQDRHRRETSALIVAESWMQRDPVAAQQYLTGLLEAGYDLAFIRSVEDEKGTPVFVVVPPAMASRSAGSERMRQSTVAEEPAQAEEYYEGEMILEEDYADEEGYVEGDSFAEEDEAFYDEELPAQ